MSENDVIRFLTAQNQAYFTALEEIKSGKKTTHWMWFIFPQLVGLSSTDISKYYGIGDLEEATRYLQHPVLRKNLIEISTAVLDVEGKNAREIFGKPDDRKLQACMTLFSCVEGADPVFEAVIARYFDGACDRRTLDRIYGKCSA